MSLWECDQIYSGECEAPITHTHFWQMPSRRRWNAGALCAKHAARRAMDRIFSPTATYEYFLPIIQPDIAAEVTTGIEAFCHALARWNSSCLLDQVMANMVEPDVPDVVISQDLLNALTDED